MAEPMTVDEVRESRKLVRIYSFEVEERISPDDDTYELGQVLRTNSGDPRNVAAPWRNFFEPPEAIADEEDPVTRVIAVESAELRRKWLTFLETRPKEDRLNLNKAEPTIEGVLDMVREVEESWASKRKEGWRGKVLSLFHRFCGSLDAHKTLLKVLPEGNEYVSLFTGVLTTIIKASVNHERVAKTFAEILKSISEHITWSQREMQLYQTPEILGRVADLYTHIFLLLGSIMDWIMQKTYKRLLDSFKENLQEQFNDEIEKVQQKAMQLRHAAEQNSRAELRATRETGTRMYAQTIETKEVVEGTRRDLRAGLQGFARAEAVRMHEQEKLRRIIEEMNQRQHATSKQFEQLAATMMNMLQCGVKYWSSSHPGKFGAVDALRISASTNEIQQTTEDVDWNSKNLESFFHRDRVRIESDLSGPVSLDPETITCLSEWIKSSGFSFLWLDGSEYITEHDGNLLTLMASHFIEAIENLQLQVISYFCELRRGEIIRTGNTWESQAMISFGYALLRQLTELLSPRFRTNIDLSEARFARLEGSVASWPEFLSLLDDVLSILPSTVFCVVDGLSWLDDRSTNDHLKKLLRVLRKKNLKVLFTTTGRSSCLLEELDLDERQKVNFTQLEGVDMRLAL